MSKKVSDTKKSPISVNHLIRNIVRTGAYDAIGSGISIQDTDYKIVYQNKTHKEIFGSHTGEYCYKAYAHLDHTCERCPLSRVLNKKGESFTEEMKLQTKKGGSCFSVTASAIKDKSGEIRAGLYTFRDLTEQRNEAEKIMESEEKYRTFFQNAMDAIFLIDPVTLKISDCNQKASELSGYAIRTLRNMNIRDLHPEEEQDVVKTIFHKASEMGTLSGICGINLFRNNGVHIPVELNLRTLHIREKDYFLCSVRDIARQKEKEEKLWNERERLINILDSVEDGIYIVNQKYDIEYVNSLLLQEFGPVEKRKCYEYFNKRKEICPWCNNKKVFTGKKVRWEWTRPKTEKTYDIIDIPLKNPDGSISKLSILHNITELKKAEEALRNSEERFRASKTERMERRMHTRYSNINECSVSFENADTIRIKDISSGGVCLKIQRELDVNSIHTIKISPPMNGEIKTKSLVVWSSLKEADADLYRYESGLKFIEMDDSLKRSIKRFIYNLT